MGQYNSFNSFIANCSIKEEGKSDSLQKLKKISSDYLGKEVKKAVITVPAYFNNEQREATKKAAENAGYDSLSPACPASPRSA